MAKFEKEEEEMKKAGASKEEIAEFRKQQNALGAKKSNKGHSQFRKGVKLIKEEDVVDDEEVVDEDTADAEAFEPKKNKKMKIDSSRLKSYGLA